MNVSIDSLINLIDYDDRLNADYPKNMTSFIKKQYIKSYNIQENPHLSKFAEETQGDILI